MAILLALEGGLPRTGKLRHPRADPKPQVCHLLGRATLWLVGPPGSGPRTLHSAREFPASALTTHQEMVAAKRQCCTIKVFVKLSWALWAILRALFRLAVSGEKTTQRLEANQS